MSRVKFVDIFSLSRLSLSDFFFDVFGSLSWAEDQIEVEPKRINNRTIRFMESHKIYCAHVALVQSSLLIAGDSNYFVC